MAQWELHGRSTCCCRRMPLLLDCCTLHARHHACRYILYMPVWSQNVCRLNGSLLPHLLWLAGRGDAGRGGPPWQLLSPSRWRPGWKDMILLALAGPAGNSRILCSVAVSGVTWPSMSDLSRKKPGMERIDPILTSFVWGGWLGGSDIGGAPTPTPERLCC